MNVVAVTAFVPIPGHPRSADTFRQLAVPLLESGLRILGCEGELEKCWLFQHLRNRSEKFTYSVGDNPQKNSLAYHVVQAQKTEWLVAAEMTCPAQVFVWIDYGIFHIPGVTVPIIERFLERAENEQAITIPGCWEKDEHAYTDDWPYWRFCGGVMVVPRDYVHRLHAAMRNEYVSWLELTGNISWEVNTLARLEKKTDLPIWWYKADHDASIFTNYKCMEYAQGSQSQAMRPQ